MRLTKCCAIRCISSLLIASIITLVFAGCSNPVSTTAAYSKPDTFTSVETSIVAENNRFSLQFDNDRKCLILEDKIDGKKWGTIPYEFYEQGVPNANIDSPIFIEYIDTTDGSVHPAKAYSSSIAMETVSAEKINNGIKIKFYFDDLQIMIPVAYTLREDSLAISIDPNEIEESGNIVIEVSLSPFFCSAQNSVEGNYLFVPSGSGALMYADEDDSGTRTFSGELFGVDPSRLVTQNATNEIPLLLPVFGVKEGPHALCGIIESGEGMANIEATAGNNRNHYSNIYPSFSLRGLDTVEARVSWSTADVVVMADSITANETITVGYYPLNGDDADYVGMAKLYRDYLQKKGLMTDKKSKDFAYGVNFLAGANVKKHFFGIPYKTLFVTTDYMQALEIINDLTNHLKQAPVVNMTGYGKTGMDPGKIAGGFEFSGRFGSERERLKVEQTIKDKKSDIFWDFDLINFKKSGNGFSSIFDTAKTANGHMAYQYFLSKSLHGIDENEGRYKLLSRNSLLKAGEKLLKAALKKKLNGISLGSLGSTAYSDYSDIRYFGKGQMDTDTSAIMKSIRDAGIKLAVKQANGYAAALSDCIFDTPMSSGDYDVFDMEVPFYQIVFKGFIPMVSSPVNLAFDGRLQVLKSIESGTALGFSVMANYDISLADTYHREFFGSQYQDNREKIIDIVTECEEYYKKVDGVSIEHHSILGDDITKTVFENGIVVYTNQGTKAIDMPEGTLKPGEFLLVEGGVQ